MKTKLKNTSRKEWLSLAMLLILLSWFYFSLPSPLFNDPYSLVLEDAYGELLGARIAEDGQWRFPEADSLPTEFSKAIVTFEDKRFWKHKGVDLRSIIRAFWQNINAGEVVSGGSTISMQTIRMARKNKSRNLYQKLIEAILATRLEMKYSKDEIIRRYASHAPFGGNVVGLEAACWRYFRKPPSRLSWAESAMLAVLPNSPALIHPGRSREKLKSKRDRLLLKMLENHTLDSTTYELAIDEELPLKPIPMPRLAPHLLDRVAVSTNDKLQSRWQSSLNRSLQRRSNQVMERHLKELKSNGIHNVAAVIAEVESGKVVAYIGNMLSSGNEHDVNVDIVPAVRSSGSILKPFLYAMAIQDGTTLPASLLPDIPARLNNYKPVNYYEDYDGVVPADMALVRSLNIPFVYLLQRYGLERFHHGLQQLGINSLRFAPDHYGLPLILGGAEVSLWDLCSSYASMARVLSHFYNHNGQYRKSDVRPLHYLNTYKNNTTALRDQPSLLTAAAIYQTFEAMRRLERPSSQGNWQSFQSSFPVAWKTGTSYGFRDAWAIGITPQYVIGVWAGNADGEGRRGLVGIHAAAPILFDLFQLLNNSGSWFDPPMDEMQKQLVCKKSGYLASTICPADTIYLARTAFKAKPCNHHKRVHLSKDKVWQLHSGCANTAQMIHESRFVLPPVEAYYYKKKNPSYQQLPPLAPGCSIQSDQPLELIYPSRKTSVFIPKELSGERSKMVCRAAHNRPSTTIYWHLDRELIDITNSFHEIEIDPPKGKHLLTLVDESGYSVEQIFEVKEK